MKYENKRWMRVIHNNTTRTFGLILTKHAEKSQLN